MRGGPVDELRTVLQESWSKAVVAATSVEEHAQLLVAKFGQKAGQLTPEQAKKLAAEVAERLTAQRQELKGQLDAAVERALDKARVPTRAALRELADKLTQLEQKLAKSEPGGQGK